MTLPPYGGSTEAVLTVVGNHYWSGYVNFECGVECDNGPSNCYLTFSQFPQAKAIKILATQVGTLTNITE